MIREIVTNKKRNVTKTEPPDEYLGKVLKLIPAEVVSVYVAAIGIMEVAENVNTLTWFWLIFAVCLIAIPLYLWVATKVRDLLQMGISTIAFVVWVFAIGNEVITKTFTGYQTAYGAEDDPGYHATGS